MNKQIESLIKLFAKLPRVGSRGATRIVLSLLQNNDGGAEVLSRALSDAGRNIKPCSICGVLTDCDICEYCRDGGRANGALCIVRDLGDVWVLEKAGIFHGRYHITNGLISGSMGVLPGDLNLLGLSSRVKNENINEIIFALPNTIEGKTTQHFIQNILTQNGHDLVCSELASGVPLGGDLDYIDDGTLGIAFGNRRKI